MLRTFMASPTFTAMGIPCSACRVALPLRYSLPSSTSSWMRKALWKISMATAEFRASSGIPPKALQVEMHRPGRNPLPARSG